MYESKSVELVIKEVERSGSFEVRLSGETICRSKTPLLSGARVLLRQGYDPDIVLAMRHEGSSVVSVRMPLGKAAELRVREDKGAPQFEPYDPAYLSNQKASELSHVAAQTAIRRVRRRSVLEDLALGLCE